MKRPIRMISASLVLALYGGGLIESFAQSPATVPARASRSGTSTWVFAVSGDSRNCGDVVMPAIAASVKKEGAAFYWHLGDFRKISDFDEDMQHRPDHLAKPLSISSYQAGAWDDFIENQIAAFGRTPVYLGIGNHETTRPKTREEYLLRFASWIDTPALRNQRLRDDAHASMLRTYYRWTESGVDFITLDNATREEFDSDQMAWLDKTLAADSSNARIHTIVLGMHEALPESISKDHSMNESMDGTESGRRVYADLLKAQREAHKRVYVLASHSHYFMDGIFNTDYWRAHGGVLPGWIVGTAGAERYPLPADSASARAAETNVYGFLLATVKPDGAIDFAFQPVREPDVPAPVVDRYGQPFVHWCFTENSVAH
ncbi:MAG TPA: metallophosphoesterase [Verrucomicrobiae bacterium]|nr:metallophosphoesterase [Verrucomicrobiae bacterium]